MALFGQAANIAQVLGVDIFKLISMIVKGAQTVRRNEEACRQISDLASMIQDRLQQLQQVSRSFEHPEMWKPIQGLTGTLRKAHRLIVACQHSSYFYKVCMGSDLAHKLESVQTEMAAWNQHLTNIKVDIIFNAFTVVLATRILHGNMNIIKQEGAHVPASGSSTSHLNTDDSDRGKLCGNQIQMVQGPHAFTEGHLPDIVEGLSTENQISRCCFWCPNISSKGTAGIIKFSFSQLAHATNYFSLENEIGLGGSSSVYKGQLNMGHVVAVKRASYEGKIPFNHLKNEIELIPKLQHANIVKLLGYCNRRRERLLVFEYMPNGSLDSFIYGARAMEALEWPRRRQIIEGIAQGAKYLHQLCEPRIIHGDLKPGNILLDSDFNPKICDFGISKELNSDADEDCSSIVTGSRGFVAPEYIGRGCLSIKSDVYSFGVTLLQIISRKRLPPPPLALSAESRDYGPLNKWAWDLWIAGGLLEFIDPSLHGEPQNAETSKKILAPLYRQKFGDDNRYPVPR